MIKFDPLYTNLWPRFLNKYSKYQLLTNHVHCIIYNKAPDHDQKIQAASPPLLSNFTYAESRQTRVPRYPVVSRDTLKEGTEVELICCQSRGNRSHLHQSQRVSVEMVAPLPPSATSYKTSEISNSDNDLIKDMTFSIWLPSPLLMSLFHLWLLQHRSHYLKVCLTYVFYQIIKLGFEILFWIMF